MLDYFELPLAGKLSNFMMRVSAHDLTAKDAAAMLAAKNRSKQQKSCRRRNLKNSLRLKMSLQRPLNNAKDWTDLSSPF